MDIKSEAYLYMEISLPGTTEPAWYKFVKEYLVGKEQERTIL